MESIAKPGATSTLANPWSVTVLDWPEQADEAGALASAGALRLLLVAQHEEPPVEWDLTSDWLRRPADPRDVLARIESLQRRSRSGQPLRLDEDGLVWRGLEWVALTPVEARLMTVFMANTHRVVKRAELVAAGWSDRSTGMRGLNTTIHRLRSHLVPLDLGVVAVRQRGFVLV